MRCERSFIRHGYLVFVPRNCEMKSFIEIGLSPIVVANESILSSVVIVSFFYLEMLAMDLLLLSGLISPLRGCEWPHYLRKTADPLIMVYEEEQE